MIFFIHIVNNLQINKTYMEITENYIDKIYFASIIRNLINNK